MKPKGPGKPLSREEIASYRVLRRNGISPEQAAKTIGRSRSWAYNFEAKEQQRLRELPPVRSRQAREKPIPSRDLSEACGFIMSMAEADTDPDYREVTIRMLEQYGPGFAYEIAKVALFLATIRAQELQAAYGEQLLDGEVFQASDVLETLSGIMRRHLSGESQEDQIEAPEFDHINYRDWLYPGEAGANGDWRSRREGAA